MNKLRKLVVLLLIPALALALAGCGFAGKMALAARKMQKLQSYRMDMDVDMDLQLSLLGKSMDMGMEISGISDVNTRPERTRTDMRVEMFGQGLTVLSYAETTDGVRTTYSSMNGGKTWTKKTAESGEGAAAAGRTDFAALLKLASAFEKTGTETVRGEESTVYSGVISAADLDSAANLSGLLGNAFSAMDLPTDSLNPAEYGSIPTTIAIGNKSGMVVRYTMDLTEFMANMMPEMMEAAMADAREKTGLGGFDLGTLGFSVETGRVFATTELYDFDAVGTIEIPAEALDAPEEAA